MCIRDRLPSSLFHKKSSDIQRLIPRTISRHHYIPNLIQSFISPHRCHQGLSLIHILAQKVRQEVWSSTPADFQKRTVPDRYKNASAVILSYYRELSTDYYRKATADLVLNLRLTRQIDCTDTVSYTHLR